ncbi:MAG: alpha-glucosidase [Pyrinomonadaceae bacterium]
MTKLNRNTSSWWQSAVFYEIYPRSFYDTNGDGIGDLNGITAKLDYLQDLGVDALWITPFYPSPQVDFGYDVSDYVAVDAQFGTLAHFDLLMVEAHKRDLRVILDLVLNHTSDQHAYFKESRSSRTNPKRDWYIWRDPQPDGSPPNNWNSAFSPCAWTFDEPTGQYYYHFFYREQPDLNWRNPEVEAALFASVRFWLERGVDGFRLDAINWMFEDEELRDNPLLPELRPGSTAEYEQELKYNRDYPETHDVLRRLRAETDKYGNDCLLIGEIVAPTLHDLMTYYGAPDDEIQLPFNFFLMRDVTKLDAAQFRCVVEASEAALESRATTHVLSNHDNPRAFDRYGDGAHDDRIAKLLATMLLTLRGAPFIYYGEEIGMKTTDPMRLEDVRDPVGRRYFPGYKGRDGERTPMQWTGAKHAGFTAPSAMPWLPVPPVALGSDGRNVAAQEKEAASILNFYKQAIRLRRNCPALLTGAYTTMGNDPHIFAYRRYTPEQNLLIALNMSSEPRTLPLDQAATGDSQHLRLLLTTAYPTQRPSNSDAIHLAPYEALVLEAVQ